MFSRRRILSIDIGSEKINLVEGKFEDNKVKIYKAVTVATPSDSFSNGRFTNIITMKNYLSRVLIKEDLNAKKVIFTTKDVSVITRILELPWVKEKEMKSMIRYEIEQYLPLNFDDYVVEYKYLNDFYMDGVRRARVSVAVFPKEMAKGYWDLAKELRLKPEALDLSANAITKLFTTQNDIKINSKVHDDNSTFGVIDLGYSQLELSIISKGVLEFTRILMSGTNHLESLDDNMDENSNKQVIDRWNIDILRMLEYFRNKYKDRNISKIYIYGGGSKLKSICEYMKTAIGIPVEVIMDMSNISIETSGESVEISHYLNAIGSIIRL